MILYRIITAVGSIACLAGAGAASAQTSSPAGAEVAILEMPAFSLPPNYGPPPAPTAAMLPPGEASTAAAAGLTAKSPGLDRQLRMQKAKTLEIAFQALNVVDAVQTVSCLRRNQCSELNPLLGRNPSAAKVIGFKAAGGLAHYLLTRELVKQNRYWKEWQIGSLVLQAGAVAWNMQRVF